MRFTELIGTQEHDIEHVVITPKYHPCPQCGMKDKRTHHDTIGSPCGQALSPLWDGRRGRRLQSSVRVWFVFAGSASWRPSKRSLVLRGAKHHCQCPHSRSHALYLGTTADV